MKRLLLLLALIGAGFFLFKQSKEFHIGKSNVALTDLDENKRATSLGVFTGEPCLGQGRRPFAVMLAGDPEARPLSGVGLADMVIEMPVSPDGITRYMAIFQCQEPQDIGSVRSARGPFLGLAKGYDTIFAHWGGERDALRALRAGALDNIDGLPNRYNAFYRKAGIPAPHDGFTSFERLWKAAQKLTYDLRPTTNNFFTFKNLSSSQDDRLIYTSIGIPYPGRFRAEYRYDPHTHSYLRFKGGMAEIDALTKNQVNAKNVLILFTRIYPIYSQYVDVELDGKEGRMQAFIGGGVFEGSWRKESFSRPLLFYDSKGAPLELEPGATWVQVVGENEATGIQN